MTTSIAMDAAANRVSCMSTAWRAPCGMARQMPPQAEGIVPEAPVSPGAARSGRLRERGARGPVRTERVPSALNDTEWLKDRILAHEKVLEELRSSYEVVPFRFGTIYLNASQVSECHCATPA